MDANAATLDYAKSYLAAMTAAGIRGHIVTFEHDPDHANVYSFRSHGSGPYANAAVIVEVRGEVATVTANAADRSAIFAKMLEVA